MKEKNCSIVIILVLFAHKKYSHSFINIVDELLTWTVLTMSLLHFWTWEHFSCAAVYGGDRELSDFIKNIPICVLKMNKGLTGLE